VILFFVDTYFKSEKNEKTCQDLTIKNSFTLGLIQCLAFIPGVSRSAATIIGGLSLGLKKTEASEFSFFLAVPTLAGASVVKLHSSLKVIQSDQWGILLLGSGIAFIVAALSIKAFMYFAQRFGFRIFGIYRIILGTFILFYFR
jgi:undecaprenyl-diphosphatase